MEKKKSFTLIEMLVTVMIVVVIASASVVSLGVAKKNTNSTTGADEIKSLIEELKSYAAGTDRERVAHYALVINTSTTAVSFCNSNSISKNQYLICASTKELPTSLATDFDRVRADHLQADVDLTANNSNIVFTVRTSDGQMGYYSQTNFYYPEISGFSSADQTISVTKDNFTKDVIINPLTGTVRFQ